MLLEKNPNMTLKNKKKQTAIDMASNKIMISLISHFLSKTPEESKIIKADTKTRKMSEKIQIKNPEVPKCIESKQKEKLKITQKPKKYIDVISGILIFGIGKTFKWNM
jgi:hypothetical protein